MLAAILEDARQNAGPLGPSVWPLEIATENLSDMMPGLVGDVGVQPIDEDAREFFPYLVHGAKYDLCTAMDMSLIGQHAGGWKTICEVGGGFGRLAEAFLRNGPCHFVMLDAVPAVLMYAYEYMRAAFPQHRIGSYYAGDTYGPGWDCYVLPMWRSDLLPDGAFDLSLNVESMQEMNAFQVAYVLGLFERLMHEGSLSYISNARDYKYRGPWPFPPNWEVLFQHNTPRSWTRDHPTVIFRKGSADYTASQQAAAALYRHEQQSWDARLASLKR